MRHEFICEMIRKYFKLPKDEYVCYDHFYTSNIKDSIWLCDRMWLSDKDVDDFWKWLEDRIETKIEKFLNENFRKGIDKKKLIWHNKIIKNQWGIKA
jgi:hypothetical protein